MTPMAVGLALDFGGSIEGAATNHPLRLIGLAERFPYNSVWAGETFSINSGTDNDPPAHAPGGLLVLSSLIPITRMELGTGILILAVTDPLRLAYETALVDQLSKGRLHLGVGVGGPELWKRFGTDSEAVADRVDETLQALRALWEGKPFQGRFVRSTGGIRPLPHRPGGPPIWVGGYKRRSAIRAALLADAYYLGSPCSFQLMQNLVAVYQAMHRSEPPAHQRAPHTPVIGVNRLTVVAKTDQLARLAAKEYLSPVLERDVARFVARQGGAHGGGPPGVKSRRIAIDQMMSEYCIVGSPDSIRKVVRRYQELGVTQINARVAPRGIPVEIAEETTELLGATLDEVALPFSGH